MPYDVNRLDGKRNPTYDEKRSVEEGEEQGRTASAASRAGAQRRGAGARDGERARPLGARRDDEGDDGERGDPPTPRAMVDPDPRPGGDLARIADALERIADALTPRQRQRRAEAAEEIEVSDTDRAAARAAARRL